MATSSDSASMIAAALAQAEDNALAIKIKAVQAFGNRCGLTRAECEGAHFSACQSRVPTGECSSTGVLIEECIDAGCGYIQDFDRAVVKLPADLQDGPDYNPTDLDVLETVCYSLVLDSALSDTISRTQPLTGEVRPLFSYFGSWNGVMRMYPGSSYSLECGDYDPRVRPWYVTSSSGPKDVVIILDISSSMRQKGRLDLAIDAVERVLDTMNEHTFVNVVIFSTEADVLTTEKQLLPATDTNKAYLFDLVESISASGSTNFEEALSTTFDLLRTSRTIGEDASSGCSTAILFLSDGEITDGIADEDQIIALVEAWNIDIEAQLFTFALGPDADTETLKEIACGTNGVYQAIPDGGALATAMSFYYRYYAIGLGSNVNYTSYSSIYEFSDSTGSSLGFTVSSPAYNLDLDPPIFLGVSGVDFTVQSFLDLGFTMPDIEEQIYRSGRFCPVFNVTECQLQKFRGSISTESVCDGGCIPEGDPLEPTRCMEDDEYPTNLWDNVDLSGMTYAERNCCGGDTFDPSLTSTTCELGHDDGSLTVGATIGICFAVLVVIAAGGIFCYRRKRATGKNATTSTAGPTIQPTTRPSAPVAASSVRTNNHDVPEYTLDVAVPYATAVAIKS